MAAHRYWRAIFPIGNSGGPAREYITIQECTMATTIGGSTVCSGGTASAGNTLGGFPASNAFDGNPGTFYSSNSGSANTVNDWLAYDFGSGNDQAIVDFQLKTLSGFEGDMPGYAIVQYSDDGSSYSNAWGIRLHGVFFDVAGEVNLISGQSGGYKYYKLNFPAPQSGNQLVLREVNFVNAIVGADGFAFNATAITAESDTGHYYQTAPEVAYNFQGEWYSANTAGAHWLKFYFGPDSPKLTQFSLLSANSAAYTSAPASITVLGSNDDVTYTNLGSFTAAPWVSLSQRQTFTLSDRIPRARIMMA